MSMACGNSLSHKCSGNSLSHVASPAMIWFLTVLIALSAALRLWMYGGASWYSTFSSTKYCFRMLAHSLSNLQSFGVSPAVLSLLKHVLYASRIVLPSLLRMGSAWM